MPGRLLLGGCELHTLRGHRAATRRDLPGRTRIAVGQQLMTATAHIVVAGSGLLGLHAAIALRPAADVTVYERLPVPGGEQWEHPEHARLVRRAHSSGVRFAAGTQVIRWEGDRVLAIGEHGGLTAADALVVATGHRPANRSELRIDGDRCAGVVPATLALHLLAQGVHLGSEVVITGDSHWAEECIAAMTTGARPAASIHWLGRQGPAPHPAVTTRPDLRVTGAHGMPRIRGVSVEGTAGRSGSGVEHLVCDCLILAGPAIPYRNIDGAVLDGDTAVFAQRSGQEFKTADQIGAAAARMAIERAKAPQHQHVPTLPRIGSPR
ncbi:FAD-dependent oxidoreductase [Mycolicibacterium vaccae]